MDKFNKLNGGIKAVLTVALVALMTGALVLLAAEKPAGEVSGRGFLGVSVRSLGGGEREELGVKFGVRVAAVEKESAAAKAGILQDDVIQSVNGEKVRDPQALSEIVQELKPGSAAKIGLWRSGKTLEVKAVLGRYERPQRAAWKVGPLTKVLRSGAYLGVNIMDLEDGDLAAYFGVAANEGVLITGIEKETPAAKAGLKAGDVIVQAGEKAVKASGDIHEALAGLKKGDSVDVTVLRHGKKETLKASPDFEHRRLGMRFFGGGKEIEIEHLELPDMHFEMPDIEIPEMPDAREIELRVHEGLDCARGELEHAREKMEQAKVKIEKRLKRIAASRWI